MANINVADIPTLAGDSPSPSTPTNNKHISHVIGAITTINADAIVNAANTSLRGGGGVDGAIHRAAGPDLLKACRVYPGCEVGDVKVTQGFRLPAKWVIHAVGPIYHRHDEREAGKLLAKCYERSLTVAREKGCKTVAFSAISTGVYGFPKVRAAGIACNTVKRWMESEGYEFDKVIFVTCPDDGVYGRVLP